MLVGLTVGEGTVVLMMALLSGAGIFFGARFFVFLLESWW
jgi:hypothetical protein